MARRTMRDVIFVSLEDWDEIWRRNQFVCAELARRHPKVTILFVEPPVDVLHDLGHGRARRIKERATRSICGLNNIIVTRPLKAFPNSLPLSRKINQKIFREHVKRVSQKLGMQQPILWINPHWAHHLAGQMGERAVIYDITDDWVSPTQYETQRRRVAQEDAELCWKADAVIVCSKKLLEMKRTMASNLHLIPNGVDVKHYQSKLNGEHEPTWRKPVLGYTGTLHPERVDVPLVEELARNMPDASVVLIGPNHLSAADRARLKACANVMIGGPVPYQDIPRYMRGFDVCITPHRRSEFTESLNPIKLWEYLAVGKPIVSTDVAGFRDYPQVVRLARDSNEFISQVREAVKENGQLREARQELAAQNSWNPRVDQIERLIAQFD